MIKAVIFDMYETLITLWHSQPYMGRQMAEDAGIPEPVFREIWDTTDADRAIGKLSFDEVIRRILEVNHRYSEELYSKIVERRYASKADSFEHLHPEIIPMLDSLKARGIKIGLITNCFLEEKEVIEKSVLYPYFDAPYMSCVVGLKKPNKKIFEMCVEELGVKPEECLYCGDGGSRELEVARVMNMKPVQAMWYLKDNSGQPVSRMPEFDGAKTPMELFDYL